VLSVHSVILGLALGAQSALAGAVIVFLAIVAHKGAAGFALGVGYQRAGRGSGAVPELCHRLC
jgi:zinc transporter 1/2/3